MSDILVPLDYSTIGGALAVALDGDNVIVSASGGPYRELVSPSTAITLTTSDGAVITGSDLVLSVETPTRNNGIASSKIGVSISGFDITGCLSDGVYISCPGGDVFFGSVSLTLCNIYGNGGKGISAVVTAGASNNCYLGILYNKIYNNVSNSIYGVATGSADPIITATATLAIQNNNCYGNGAFISALSGNSTGILDVSANLESVGLCLLSVATNKVFYDVGQSENITITGSVQAVVATTGITVTCGIYKKSDDSLVSPLVMSEITNFTDGQLKTLATIKGSTLSKLASGFGEYYAEVIVSGGSQWLSATGNNVKSSPIYIANSASGGIILYFSGE